MQQRAALIMAVSAVVAGVLTSGVTQAETVRNGFVLEPGSIPAAEILAGGPPRDGIPALDHPATVPAAQADWADDSLVLGIVAGGEARERRRSVTGNTDRSTCCYARAGVSAAAAHARRGSTKSTAGSTESDAGAT